jgi:hypothetical protein
MNITVTKVLRELKNKHGWQNMNIDNNNKWFIEHLIKDTIDVINDELIKYKNIKIKKNK